MQAQFKSAVLDALGPAVSPGNVTMSAAVASGSHLRKTETITVTTAVALGKGTTPRGTSSAPGLTYKNLQGALISRGVTSTVPSAHAAVFRIVQLVFCV